MNSLNINVSAYIYSEFRYKRQRSILTSNDYIALLMCQLHEVSCFFYWYTSVCDKRTISVEYMKKNVVLQN